MTHLRLLMLPLVPILVLVLVLVPVLALVLVLVLGVLGVLVVGQPHCTHRPHACVLVAVPHCACCMGASWWSRGAGLWKWMQCH